MNSPHSAARRPAPGRFHKPYFEVLEDRNLLTVAIWDGGGADGKWSTAANWVGDVGPVAGDFLKFDAGALQKNAINDFAAGTAFQGIEFADTGYTLTGNAIKLQTAGGGITNDTGSNAVNLNVTIANNSQSFTVTAGNLSIGGTLTVNTSLNLQGAGAAAFTGVMSGSSAMNIQGSGIWTLSGTNSYSGAIAVSSSATLRLSGGDALTYSASIGLSGTSTLELLANESMGAVIGDSGTSIKLNTFELYTLINSNVTSSSVISGSGAFEKAGTGTLTLAGANTLTGEMRIYDGTMKFATTAVLPATSRLYVGNSGVSHGYLDLNGNDLTVYDFYGNGDILLGTNTLHLDVDDFSSFTGKISGTGGITKTGDGTVVLQGSNTYTGTTRVEAGRLSIWSGGSLSTSTALVVAGGAFELDNGRNQTVASVVLDGGALSLFGIGSATLRSNSDFDFRSGSVSVSLAGSVGVNKTTAGLLSMSGVSSYTGATTIDGGTMRLLSSGSIASTVSVNAGGTLGGQGTVNGMVNVAAGGTLRPGDVGDTIGGTLVVRNLNLVASSTLFVRLRYPFTMGFDSIAIQSGGSASLGGATLAASINGTLATGSTFNVITRLGSGSITGTFAGGSMATFGAYEFALNYPSGYPQLVYVGTTVTWTGAGSNNLWSNAANWLNGILPTVGSKIIFDSSAVGGFISNNNIGGIGIRGITFAAGGFTVTGSTISLNASAAVSNQAGSNEIAASLSFSSSQIFDVGAGVLTLAGSLNAGTTNYALSGAGTGIISGNASGGNVTVSGSGTWTFSGNNTFSTLTAGESATVKLAGSRAIYDLAQVVLNATASIQVLDYETIGRFSGVAGTSIVLNAGLTAGDNNSTTYSGSISGSGGLTKRGTGGLTLNGNNTYSGSTQIQGGAIYISGGNAIGDQSAVVLIGGNLYFQSGASETIGSVATAYSLTLDIGSGTLTVGGDNTSTTFVGTIYGSASSKIKKVGSGSLTISGFNVFSGSVDVNAGALIAAGGRAIGDTSSVTVAAGATFQVNANETIGQFSAAANSSIILNAGTLTFTENSTATVAGNVSGSGGITKYGAAALTLSGNNTYSGATTVYAGNVSLIGGSAIGDLSTVAIISNNSHLTLNANETVGGLSNSGSIDLGGNTLTAGDNGSSTNFFGVITGTGSFVKTGTGTLMLGYSSTYTGTTMINGGTLKIGGTSGMLNDATAVSIASGATFDVSYNETVGSITGAAGSSIRLAVGAVLTAGGNNASTTFSGSISGLGNLTKRGTGALTLDGMNTFTGTMQVAVGVVKLTGGSAFADLGSVSVLSGASLVLNTSETIGLTNAYSGSTVVLNGSTLTTGAKNGGDALYGVISGTGGLTKVGATVLTLGAVNTYSGPTRINSGSIAVGANNALSGAVTINGGTLVIGTRTLALAGVSLLSGSITGTTGSIVSATSYDVRSGSVSATLNGAVGLIKSGGGTVTLTGANAYTGSTIVNSGVLLINGSQPVGAVQLNGGVLGGSGTHGSLSAIGGVVSPGNSPGRLNVAGDASLSNVAMQFEINGADPASGYDQLVATGHVNLSGAVLDLRLGYGASIGSHYVILRNDGADPISGAFANEIPGWTIDYLGGDGNDIVITFVGLPPAPPALPEIPTQIVFPPPNGTTGSGGGTSGTTSGGTTTNESLASNLPAPAGLVDAIAKSTVVAVPGSVPLAQGLFSMNGPQDFREQDAKEQRYWTDGRNSSFGSMLRHVEGVVASALDGSDAFSQSLAPFQSQVTREIAEGLATGSSADEITRGIELKVPNLDRSKLDELVQRSSIRIITQRVADLAAGGRLPANRIAPAILREFPHLNRSKVQAIIENALKSAKKTSADAPNAPAPSTDGTSRGPASQSTPEQGAADGVSQKEFPGLGSLVRDNAVRSVSFQFSA